MRQIYKNENNMQIEKNIMFVTTIYDSFEALEETLSKLQMKKPADLVRQAKNLFALEVFKYAKENNMSLTNKQAKKENRIYIN